MRIRVRLFALYRELAGKSEVEVEVEDGTTVAAVIEGLARDYPRLSGYSNILAVAVNAQYVDRSFKLGHGDEIALIPPVSGGSMVEITEEAIVPEPLIEMVRRDTDGAVVNFVGVVRGHSGGRKVLFLEYEAYKEMAERKLSEIAEEIRSRWHLEGVIIHQRVGHLEVGEVALVVVIAAPHRKEAFEACQYAIDRLKQVVPVWKREVFEDGEVWVGGGGP